MSYSRRIALISILLVSTLATVGCDESTPQEPALRSAESKPKQTTTATLPVQPGKSDIGFLNGQLTIRGKTITFPMPIEKLISIIGDPHRKSEKVN